MNYSSSSSWLIKPDVTFSNYRILQKVEFFLLKTHILHIRNNFFPKNHEITIVFHQKITKQVLEPLNKSIFIQWVHGFSSMFVFKHGLNY
jgi:hypothetical protein